MLSGAGGAAAARRFMLAILPVVALCACGGQPDFDRATEAYRDFVQLTSAAQIALDQGRQETHEKLTSQADGALVEAIARFRRQDILDTGDAADLKRYAHLMHDARDYDLAAEALQRAAEFDPDDPEIWLRLGQNLARLGPVHAAPAHDALERALDAAEEDAMRYVVRRALARWYWDQGLYREAGEALVALGGAEGVAEALAPELSAFVALYRGDVEGALGFWRSATAEAAAVDERWRQREQLREALEVFRAMRRIVPDTADAQAAYAELLTEAGRLPDALGPLRLAVELDPAAPARHVRLADAARQLGREDLARDAYARALELDPDLAEARDALEELTP
jgi:tetratricopeptide (TPR) repeat protein